MLGPRNNYRDFSSSPTGSEDNSCRSNSSRRTGSSSAAQLDYSFCSSAAGSTETRLLGQIGSLLPTHSYLMELWPRLW